MNNIIRFEEQTAIAKAFKDSGLFPDIKSEAQAIVKIQAGLELGLEPFAAMQGIEIIQGKCKQSASLQAALIKRSGKYTYKLAEETPNKCRLQFFEIHNGTWESLGFVEYTTEEAKQAGLLSKQNWQKHLSDMLFARAVSRGARRFTPDIFITGAYNESDEFETVYQPIVQVDNTGLDAIKAKVQAQNTVIEATIAEPVAEAAEPIIEPVVEPIVEVIKFKIEDGDDFQTVLDGLNNASTIESLITQREFIKSELDLTAEQLETVKKRFSERQKEIRNANKTV